jgi:arginyl-tRNA synthetase
MVLTRGNGTSLYGLRDLAYNIDKIKKAKKNVVLLGEEQKLYFRQISAALSLLKQKPPEVVHYSYVLLPGAKMSTRKGNVVMLTDFMKESIEKAKQEIKNRNLNINEKELEKLAKEIGYSALKYSMLKVSPDKNIIFSWDDALNFEGNSAPYIQYTAVRAKKVLENVKTSKPAKLKFENKSAFKLIKGISEFPAVIKECAEQYKPYLLANYAFKIATDFNEFYEMCPVMQETDNTKKKSKAVLVKAYLNVITHCLNLMGLYTPGYM